jgi:hypothetical protein
VSSPESPGLADGRCSTSAKISKKVCADFC